MVNFLFSAYFGSHFCYHSNGKSKSNNFYILASYGGGRGAKSTLMHELFFQYSLSVFLEQITRGNYFCKDSQLIQELAGQAQSDKTWGTRGIA